MTEHSKTLLLLQVYSHCPLTNCSNTDIKVTDSNKRVRCPARQCKLISGYLLTRGGEMVNKNPNSPFGKRIHHEKPMHFLSCWTQPHRALKVRTRFFEI